jgi:hypothetical protein
VDEIEHGQRVTIQQEGQTATIISLHLVAPYIESHKSRRLFSLPIVTNCDGCTPNEAVGTQYMASLQNVSKGGDSPWPAMM